MTGQSVGEERLEAVAVQAARAAGVLLRRRFGELLTVGFKGSEVDLVTEVDREAERLAVGIIRHAFRSHRIVGEEGSGDQLRGWESGYAWFVDPLDGTTNYVQGIPFFCVSVAACRDGEVVAGVVYDPMRDELFRARRGGGAYLGERPLRVSAEGRLVRCVLATGTAVGRHGEWPRLIGDLEAVGPRAGNVRFLGAAALHLAYVAAGRLDGFWERRLSPWDMAAGTLLVAEAGGRVTTPQGEGFTLSSDSVLATNGRIHEEMTALLNGKGGDGDGRR